MLVVLVAPELYHSAKVKLADNFVLFEERVHVGLESLISVDALPVEFDFNETIGVCSNNEVDFGPVNHDDLFDVVDHVCKLPRG